MVGKAVQILRSVSTKLGVTCRGSYCMKMWLLSISLEQFRSPSIVVTQVAGGSGQQLQRVQILCGLVPPSRIQSKGEGILDEGTK